MLTFQEVADLFEAADIHPERFEEDLRENSSTAGRIYARTGGVSQAVQDTLNRVNPGREVPLRALQADGAAACKELLAKIAQGDITANYLEGMGCVGGCVGGPKRMASVEHGTQMADLYAEQAAFATPVDNPYVLELLRRLGFETIEELTAADSFLTRTF